jgi:glycerophosphoryl diester phosphodiesterase
MCAALMLLICHGSTNAEAPKVVAHRGLLLHAPENTISNFRACLEMRLGFEFDVAKSKDGHLVCIHDDTVERTTNGKGMVSDLTLDQLQQLDAGTWFDQRFAGEKIPSVEEVLKLVSQYKDNDVLIAVDLKAADVEIDVVRLARKHDVLDRLLFIGRTISDSTVRDRIRAAATTAHTAAVCNDTSEFLHALEATNADWVYFRYLPSREELISLHSMGKRSFIAGGTVSGNTPENWRKAIQVNIDAILTDHPLELLMLLRTAK